MKYNEFKKFPESEYEFCVGLSPFEWIDGKPASPTYIYQNAVGHEPGRDYLLLSRLGVEMAYPEEFAGVVDVYKDEVLVCKFRRDAKGWFRAANYPNCENVAAIVELFVVSDADGLTE